MTASNLSIDFLSVLGFGVGHSLFVYGLLMYAVTWKTFLLSIAFYCFTTFSLSAGYHRLWAHKAYSASFPLKLFMLLFGAGGFVGSALNWCYFQRAHHRYLDTPRDPTDINKGFFYAHIGWRFYKHPKSPEIDVKDLEDSFLVKIQNILYFIVAPLTGLVLPALIANTWNDPMGGLFFAGFGRIVLCQHAHFLTQSICHIWGTQSYTKDNSARNFFPVALLTFGEGYRNFHHLFPRDYRHGPRPRDFDAMKWILYLLSFTGLVSDLHVTDRNEVMQVRVQMKQKKLDVLKAKLNFGPDIDTLPVWNWAEIERLSKEGSKLLVVDGLVYDMKDFMRKHPGGVKIIQYRLGKDATLAFNGALYRHSKAARNIALTLRVAKLPKEEMNLRTDSDHIPSDFPTSYN